MVTRDNQMCSASRTIPGQRSQGTACSRTVPHASHYLLMKYPLQISLAVRQGLNEPFVNKLVRVNSWHRKPQVCPLVEMTLPGEEAKVPSLTSCSQEAELVYTTIYSSRSLAINAFFFLKQARKWWHEQLWQIWNSSRSLLAGCTIPGSSLKGGSLFSQHSWVGRWHVRSTNCSDSREPKITLDSLWVG